MKAIQTRINVIHKDVELKGKIWYCTACKVNLGSTLERLTDSEADAKIKYQKAKYCR